LEEGIERRQSEKGMSDIKVEGKAERKEEENRIAERKGIQDDGVGIFRRMKGKFQENKIFRGFNLKYVCRYFIN